MVVGRAVWNLVRKIEGVIMMGFKDIPLALFFRLPGEVVGELAK